MSIQVLLSIIASALAIAVGYPDVVATIGGITLNQTGQAVECIAITMAVYLTFSLIISMGMMGAPKGESAAPASVYQGLGSVITCSLLARVKG